MGVKRMAEGEKPGRGESPEEKEEKRELAKQLGPKLRQIRSAENLTQDEAARLVGRNQANWQQYENEGILPPTMVMRRIAERFHVSLNWLYGLPDPQGLTDEERDWLEVYRAARLPVTRRNMREQARHTLRLEEDLTGVTGRGDATPERSAP